MGKLLGEKKLSIEIRWRMDLERQSKDGKNAAVPSA